MKNSTKAILAKRALHHVSAQDYIDWAVDMLVKGNDSPSLRILAGLDRHNRFWEVKSYFLHSIKELNIEEIKGNTAIRSYANEVLQQIINEQFSSQQLVVNTLSGMYWDAYHLYARYSHDDNNEQFSSQQLVVNTLSGMYWDAYYLYPRYSHDDNYDLLCEFDIWRKLDNALNALLAGDFPHDYPSATLENFDTIVKQETEKFTAKMVSYK